MLIPWTYIFLSYAREDQKQAEQVKKLLEENHISVWMDQTNLLPGQRWDRYIRKAIDQCAGAVFLASRYSLSKDSYVQREIDALSKRASTMPQDDVFIIILRIEDVPITDSRLQPFHWVDFFFTKDSSPKAFLKIVRSAWQAEEHSERLKDRATLNASKDEGVTAEKFDEQIEKEEQEKEYLLATGTTGRLFLPEELDIYCNKKTKEAYIFHGKVISYDISHLIYVPEDHSIIVVMNDKTRLDLGVKLQWLVRPHFLKASEIMIVLTKNRKSLNGTTVPLRMGIPGTSGALVYPTHDSGNLFTQIIKWLLRR